mmetsp:Transcript_29929/g.76778  ORF Transcript_29929/g.76778 Transcript_29929/m.76778 type:complete len:238 (+) Transcript_29929:117-830(+)
MGSRQARVPTAGRLPAGEVLHVGAEAGVGGAAEAHGGGAVGAVGRVKVSGRGAGGREAQQAVVAPATPRVALATRLVRHPDRQVRGGKGMRRLEARAKLRRHGAAAGHAAKAGAALLVVLALLVAPLLAAALLALLVAAHRGGGAVRVVAVLLRRAAGVARAPGDVGVREIEEGAGAQQEVRVKREEHLQRPHRALFSVRRRGQPGGAVQQLQRRRLPRKLLRHGRQALGHGVQARR